MANYREDFANINLETGTISRNFMNHSIGGGDALGDRFGVRVFRNGEAVTLGGTCAGYFVRNTTGETVVITDGVVSGNEAYVTLPAACYAVEGSFTLAIKVTVDSEIVTLRIVDGVVDRTNTSVIVDPGDILPSIEDLLQAIEDAVESIPADYSSLWASLAPAFSTSIAYKAGQYVTYDGKFWRFTTDHAAGAWNAAHATQVNVGGDMSDLKSALANNKLLWSIIENSYVKTNGEISSYSGWNRTDYTLISDFAKLIAKSSAQSQYNVFYNANKTALCSFTVGTTDTEIEVPLDAVYVIFSNTASGMNNLDVVGVKKTALEIPVIKSIVNKKTITATGVGNKYAVFPVYNGHSYRFISNSNEYISIASVNDAHTTIQDMGGTTAGNNQEKIVTATADASNIVFYFRASGSISVEDISLRLPAVEIKEEKDEGNYIPSYYKNHTDTKIGVINALDNVDIQFAFVTDMHYPTNAENSPALIHYIDKRIPLNFIVQNGDVLNQLASKSEAIQFISEFNSMFSFDENYYPVIGNHEYNDPSGDSESIRLSMKQVRLATYGKKRDIIADDYTAYYFDDEPTKCRYYFIGCGRNALLYDEDVAWLTHSLTTIPDGYGVIVFSHSGLTYDSSYNPTGVIGKINRICDALLAVANRVSSFHSYIGVDEWLDFSNLNATPIGVFSGHVHFDGYYQYTNANYNGYIYVIATTCDAYGTQVVGSEDRSAGTKNEQAFDIVSVDKSNRKIYMTRIGAGDDRTFTISSYQ